MFTDQHSQASETFQLETGSAQPSSSDYYSSALAQMQQTKKRPKNPLSAFCRYSQIRRAELKAEHPEVLQKKILAQIRREWKDLGDKTAYTSLAKRDYEDFKRLQALWDREYKGTSQFHCSGMESNFNDEGSKEVQTMKRILPSPAVHFGQLTPRIEQEAPRRESPSGNRSSITLGDRKARGSNFSIDAQHDQIPSNFPQSRRLAGLQESHRPRCRHSSFNVKRGGSIPSSHGAGSLRSVPFGNPSRFRIEVDNESSRSIWTTSDELAEQEVMEQQQLLELTPQQTLRKRERKAEEKQLVKAEPGILAKRFKEDFDQSRPQSGALQSRSDARLPLASPEEALPEQELKFKFTSEDRPNLQQHDQQFKISDQNGRCSNLHQRAAPDLWVPAAVGAEVVPKDQRSQTSFPARKPDASRHLDLVMKELGEMAEIQKNEEAAVELSKTDSPAKQDLVEPLLPNASSPRPRDALDEDLKGESSINYGGV